MASTIPALLLHVVGVRAQCTTSASYPEEIAGILHDGGVESLGGYRLVRQLGAGSRSTVWLGTDGSATVAIKAFREGESRDRIDVEIESLGRVSSRHVVGLEDLAMGPDGVPCLILRRLSSVNLGRVLAGPRPRPGEAVTMLAPLCLAVAELHRVGVAHGRIGGSRVLFDDGGAPVLASFGGAELFGPMPVTMAGVSVPPAQLQRHAAVAADREGIAGLCRSALDPESEIIHWLAEPGAQSDPDFAQELAERLFRLAPAEPVRGAMLVAGTARSHIPSRLADPQVPAFDTDATESAGGESSPHRTMTRHAMVRNIVALMHLPDGMADALFDGWGRRLATWVTDAVRPVRKPVWVMAGLVAACVVAVTALLPPAGSDAVGDEDSAALPETLAASSNPAPAAVVGNDPLAAADALLTARADCFDALSVLCLDQVNQRGSAAMESDVAQMRLLQEGGAADGALFIESRMPDNIVSHRQVTMVEELGDTVLLAVTIDHTTGQGEGFSLLLMKTHEGWRIRDITPATKGSS